LEHSKQSINYLSTIISNHKELAEKYKYFNLTGNSFTWKNQVFNINELSHIGIYRAVITHTIFSIIPIRDIEQINVGLTFSTGQIAQISVNEQGFLFKKSRKEEIELIADFCGYLRKTTFDQRLEFYESQVEKNGYWEYNECLFYPHQKIVYNNQSINLTDYSFFRDYGIIQWCRKGIDPLSEEQLPELSTLLDTDIIFYMLDKYMDLSWDDK
jgi:hypothetical protein